MFSMSPTLQNSLNQLYQQYKGPQTSLGPGGQGGAPQWNPMQPMWQQGLNMQPPQVQPINSQPMGPALNMGSPPGMATQPAGNPNILALLQQMMSGTPMAGQAPPPPQQGFHPGFGQGGAPNGGGGPTSPSFPGGGGGR